MADVGTEPDHDADLSREFARLRDEVYERLRRAADVPDARRFRVGQLLVLPSFWNPHRWDVLRHPHGVYTLYCTCWRLDLDYPPFESRADRTKHAVPFIPTVEAAAVPVPSDQLRGLLDDFRGISIPVGSVADLPAEDETAFELLICDAGRGCRLSWFGNVPPSWRPLQPLIKRMSDAFEIARANREG